MDTRKLGQLERVGSCTHREAIAALTRRGHGLLKALTQNKNKSY